MNGWTYEIWWKETSTQRILHTTVYATNKEDAKEKILKEFGYKSWDVKFSKIEIV